MASLMEILMETSDGVLLLFYDELEVSFDRDKISSAVDAIKFDWEFYDNDVENKKKLKIR